MGEWAIIQEPDTTQRACDTMNQETRQTENVLGVAEIRRAGFPQVPTSWDSAVPRVSLDPNVFPR